MVIQLPESHINTFDTLRAKFMGEQQQDDDDVCISPEKDVPWAFLNGECISGPMPLPTASMSTRSNSHACGFCGTSAAASYLRELRDEIAHKHKQKCEGSIIVYGAALGEAYKMWMNNRKFLPRHNKEVTNKEDGTTCFFQFVTNYNGKLQSHSIDKSQTLIHINATKTQI